MQIKDYITKNFPSLNWNILPQIFAENGVEMNEEIEAYLRNTPENTNWNVVGSLSTKDIGSLPQIIEVAYQNHNCIFTDNSDIKNFSDFKAIINKYAIQPDPERSNYWTISAEYMKLKEEDSDGRSTNDGITWRWYSGGNIFEFNTQNETISIYSDD